jgi:hypothetical protein
MNMVWRFHRPDGDSNPFNARNPRPHDTKSRRNEHARKMKSLVALSRDQLNEMARKIPGARVLNETFKNTVTAIAVPLGHPQSLPVAKNFMKDAKRNGPMHRA